VENREIALLYKGDSSELSSNSRKLRVELESIAKFGWSEVCEVFRLVVKAYQ